jgi:hypothetical protein
MLLKQILCKLFLFKKSCLKNREYGEFILFLFIFRNMYITLSDYFWHKDKIIQNDIAIITLLFLDLQFFNRTAE